METELFSAGKYLILLAIEREVLSTWEHLLETSPLLEFDIELWCMN